MWNTFKTRKIGKYHRLKFYQSFVLSSYMSVKSQNWSEVAPTEKSSVPTEKYEAVRFEICKVN